MADFALWATACEPVFCPGSGFLQAYKANRRSAVDDVVDADPVAARIRDIMAERTMWTGSASDLLRVAAPYPRDDASWTAASWPRSPRALAGRLRRAQAPLRALGIEVTFGREGRAGTRVIRMTASRRIPPAVTVSTVSANRITYSIDKPSSEADNADGADGSLGEAYNAFIAALRVLTA